MRRVIMAVAAILFCTSHVSADQQDKVTFFTLGNGMDVVVIEDHRAPVVTQMVWYRAGSADETPGRSGVAHFLEHLLFKGTEKRAPGELSNTVARNGGRDNAFTSYDYTAYFQRVAADRLELMMDLESDRMRNLKLDEEDILIEREVIIEERNQRTENSPAALFREQKRAAQYLNHRYGIPVIGWKHEMEALDLEAALAFYERFYAPNNAILVVAGDVNPEDVKTLAEKYYGVIAPNSELEARARPQDPPQTAERRVIFRDARVSQPYVSRTYLAPERDSGDQRKAAALTLLAELLGGGTTSYMAEQLQFETQRAVYTGSWYDGDTVDDTGFTVVVVPSEGISLEEAEADMDRVLAGYIEKGVDAEALARIKMQFHAAQIYARDNVDGLANKYGQALAIGLTVEDVQEWPAIVQSITAEEIIDAAKDVFNRDRAVTGFLLGAEGDLK